MKLTNTEVLGLLLEERVLLGSASGRLSSGVGGGSGLLGYGGFRLFSR